MWWSRSAHWTSSHWTLSHWTLFDWSSSHSTSSRWTLSRWTSSRGIVGDVCARCLTSVDIGVVVFVVVAVDVSVLVVDVGVTVFGLDCELPATVLGVSVGPVVAAVAVVRIPAVAGLAGLGRRCRRCRSVLASEPPLPSGSAFGPLPGPRSNACRRESPEKTRARQRPKRRRDHTGTGRRPRRRPTRRRAHANPRRHHPSRRHRAGYGEIRSFSHKRAARFAVDLNLLATGTHRSGR